jgi:predicted nucleic acid-binding protein
VVEPVTIEIHDAGTHLAEVYRLSAYEAMIASAALLAECDTLFSEDLQDRLLISITLLSIFLLRRVFFAR